ncbi:MAG TPA: tail fiber protein [Conexibacter sp.]|jgi:microcystin-dependent protein
MTDPFAAEIRIFGFTFAPTGWAHCDGQLMPISQNTALFSLLGTSFGGDGKSTFGLPGLQGRAPLQQGQGPGLSLYDLGEQSGTETLQLLESEIPQHGHTLQASLDPAAVQAPRADRALAHSSPGWAYQSDTSSGLTAMAPEAVAPFGGGVPHNNMPPTLTMNFCIALQGEFPPRP